MVALFSAALLLYYAFLKTNAYMIISINGFGCLIEIFYIAVYLFYAPTSSKVQNLEINKTYLYNANIANNEKGVTKIGIFRC